MQISSVSNPMIKDVVKLYKRKFRDDTQLFVLEGRREVERLSSTFTVLKAFTTRDPESFDACNYPIFQVTPKVFEKISMRGEPSGIVVIAEQKHMSQEAFFKALPAKPTLLVLDGIEKPGNVGAILRSSVAFGIDGVILSDCPIDLFNPNLLRSCISCVMQLPILTSNHRDVLQELNSRGVELMASSLEGAEPLSNANLQAPMALVLGSEDKGVSNPFLSQAKQKVKISMNQDAVDSLNVSVAAAIFCYELDKR